jgi:putative tryptophan/tyrosine transport system substrate-binding protein
VPRWFAEEGGLMAYAARYVVLFRKAAVYVDKILKDAQPADLPVEQPTHFELVINMKTAKALGIDVPPTPARPRRRGDRVGCKRATSPSLAAYFFTIL